jgi:hypothetical protein
MKNSLVICAVAVFACCGPGLTFNAFAQSGISAEIKRAPKTVESELKRRIDELERRVFELEKEKAETVEAPKEEDAQQKRFEQRLAAIEKAQQKSEADGKPAPKNSSTAEDFDPLNVRAPFVIRDDDGKVIFRVDRSPTNNAIRATVGDPAQSRVVMAVDGDTPVVTLMGAESKSRLSLIGAANERRVTVYGSGSSTAIMSAKEGTTKVELVNNGGFPVAHFAVGASEAGRMMLANQSGSHVVEAGVLTSGVGVVRAGPKMGGAPGGLAMPFAIMGKKE